MCNRVLFVVYLLFIVLFITVPNSPCCVVLQLLHALQLFEHVHPTFTVHPPLVLSVNV